MDDINNDNKIVRWWRGLTGKRKALLISFIMAILIAITLYILGCVFFKTDPTPNTAAAGYESNAKGGDANMNFVIPGVVSTLYAVFGWIVYMCYYDGE